MIKFKGYSKPKKVWYDRVLAGCNSDGTDYICNLVWIDEQKDWLNFDGDIVQFTGLTDLSGKEIYDGHILKYYAHSFIEAVTGESKKECFSVIRWNKEELCWGLYNEEQDRWTNNLTLSGDDKQFEIVGHVFEKE